MALFDAFSGFIKESVEGAIENVLERLESRGSIMEAPRALQYARTTQDAMRVNIENTGYQVVFYPGNSSSNAYTGWMSANAVFQVDEREQQRIQSEQQFNMVRQGRWTFS